MKRYAQIANFNIVFGEEEKPMLDYFDTVIFPAFTSDIRKVSDGNEYLFMNVKISEDLGDNYILIGQFVKKTILEVKSDINEEGDLIEKNEKYSSAPYSTFAINLMNHRMIYVPNQKGSPTLVNFRSAVKYIINSYLKEKNRTLNENEKLEDAFINIVGIPSANSMDELLKNVEKINKLTLRFYPLNGDIDYSEVFGVISRDMRETVDCKRGEIVFKSPKSIDGVQNIIEKAGGTIDPILQVTTKEKSKATLRDYELSERYELEFDDSLELGEESSQVVKKMSNINSLNFSNDLHKEIYEKNKGKIIPFIKDEGDEDKKL